MKNQPRDNRITRGDFDSLFLWRVFWKIFRQENPVAFFGKVLLLAAFFVFLILFIVLLGEFAGA